jgi:hypothetical protein
MNSGRPAFRFAPCGLHSDSPCQTAAIVLAGACAPSFGKIHCPWPKPRGMERRSAPHQFKLRLLAKTLRLPALHHGVLNPGPRFSEDRHRPPSQPSSWQAVLALLRKKLTAARSARQKTLPPGGAHGAPGAACARRRQRAPFSIRTTGRTGRAPRGSRCAQSKSGPESVEKFFYSRMKSMAECGEWGKSGAPHVARMERSAMRVGCQSRPSPDFAEFTLGPATDLGFTRDRQLIVLQSAIADLSDRTRGLHPGYA